MPPSFQLRDGHRQIFGSPAQLVNQGSSAANQWFGTVAITSNTNVVSTALVSSASLIFLTLKNESSTNSSGTDVPLFGVQSISPGGFFLIGTVGSVALVGSYTAFY